MRGRSGAELCQRQQNRGDRQRHTHLGVLLVFEVLVDGGVEVLGVALVEAVDLPLGLDPHVPLGQDELADGLSVKSGEDERQVKKKKNRVNIERRFREGDFLRFEGY